MDWYHYIALVMIITQLLFAIQMVRNYKYVLKKFQKERTSYRPRTVLIIPCKGLDLNFEKNITSFFKQDYENYLLWFVVEDQEDPAYGKLCQLKKQLEQNSKAKLVQILIAGKGQQCSQKIHNLLHCYRSIGEDVDVMAFADSDICVHSDWLSHIVYPLRKENCGASSGYRWFIPKKNNLATLALSSVNAKVAQLLGNTHFNQVWGGSMAIRVETFRKLGLEKIWEKSLSDDLSLSISVKKARLKVAFVPACIAASYEITSWKKLFEFGRRQFLITRIHAPGTWWFGLLCSLYSVLGLWGSIALAAYGFSINAKYQTLLVGLPAVFFLGQMSRAILRQKMISKVLKEHLSRMKYAIAADIIFFWAASIIMLVFIVSSAIGRTIKWRGILYKIQRSTNTIVVAKAKP